ncbi:substrate-binding domain-containing protein [Acuticoccus sp. M5D2P5]|uniref:substrate-binding domain-containing protein n=1 Tax=Acuticoccus kalidii TaxID=2910977 RepID=UPI001F246697|nr:substrate-binding domain-containing protein [Acuticoccus kalidii]MCF3934913.1 substrate-binding domain-containing protein [Acuticoccus kalidii]
MSESPEPALTILSGGAANGLVSRLEPRFTRETGLAIRGDFGAVGAVRDRIVAGEAVDIIILTHALVDALADDGHAERASIRDIGTVTTGIGVQSGEPIPDVSTPEALRSLLSDATALYVPDTTRSTAGRHVAGVLAALGLASRFGPHLKEFPNGQTAMRAMAADAIPGAVGCTQITEILNTEGVDYAGDLPGAHGLATVYTAAVHSAAANADAARRLVTILTDPAEADARRAAGFA